MDNCIGLRLSDQAVEMTIPRSMNYILRKVERKGRGQVNVDPKESRAFIACRKMIE
jgi:hypothetical protein